MYRAIRAILLASILLAVLYIEARADLEVNPTGATTLGEVQSDSRLYFKNYLFVLKQRSAASSKYSGIKEKLSLLTESFDEETAKLSLLESDLQKLKNDFASVPQQKAFIERGIRQVAEKKLNIEADISSLPEFSDKAAPNQMNLRKKVSFIQTNISSFRQEISRLEGAIQNLKASSDYQNRVSERNRYRTHLAKARSEENQLQAEIDSLSSQISQNRNEVNDGRDHISRIEFRRNRIANRLIPEKRRENLNWRQEVQNLNGQIQQSESRLPDLRTKLSNNRSRRLNLESELNPLRDRLSNFQKRLKDLREERKNKATPEEKAEVQARIDELKSQKIAPLRQQIKAKEDQIAEVKQRGRNLANRIKRNEDQIKSSQRNIRRIRASIQENRRDIAELESESTRLASRKREWESYIDQLNLDYGNLDFQLNSSRNQLISLQSDIRSLESSLNSAQSQVNSFIRQNIRPVEVEIDGIESSIGNLQSRIGVLNSYDSALQRNSDNKLQAEQSLVELDQLLNNYPTLLNEKKSLVTKQGEVVQAKALEVRTYEIRSQRYKARVNSLPGRVRLLERDLQEKIQTYKDSL